MAAVVDAKTRIETYTHKDCFWHSDTKSYGSAGMMPAGAATMSLYSCNIEDPRVRYCYFGVDTAHPIDVKGKKGLANFDFAFIDGQRVLTNRTSVNPSPVISILFYDADGGFLNGINGSWKFEVKYYLQ